MNLRREVTQPDSGVDAGWRSRWILATAIVLTLLCGRAAWAADAILSWSLNTESDVAGYRVYYGPASGSYQTVIDAGLVATYTVTGLGPGTYYFALTAYNRAGAESAFSNEVSKVIADTIPPVISAVAASSITSTAATITWTTSEPATSLVEYGTGTSYGLQTTENLALAGSHQHRLTGLQASTTYHYRVLNRDAAGNLSVSADRTFTTAAPAPADTAPPTISAVAAGSVTASSATVTWTTNEAATTQVQYGTTTAYGSTTTLNSTLLTTHSQALSGLAASTTYNFRVLSRDAAGNLATSANFTFRTLAAADTTAPTISSLAATNVTSTGATVTWTTNEAATTQVQYGTTTAYGATTTLNSALLTTHSQALTGLAASTTYNFRVLSRDAAGNLATSANFTLRTLAADTTAPTISAVAAASVTTSGATITWTTNEAATTQIQYGATTAYGAATSLNSTLLTAHSQSLSGLTAGGTYHYRVLSRDAAGNLATSGDFVVNTPAGGDTIMPTISGVSVKNVTGNSAVVIWFTNEGSTTQVQYGATTTYGALSSLNTTLVTDHKQMLTNLAAGKTYHFRVLSRDAAGNLAISGDFTVTTLAGSDTTAPTISAVSAGSVTSSGATITWTTNEAATTQIQYGSTTAYGSTTTLNSTLLTTHSQALAGLAAATTYQYRVLSRDAAGNLAASGNFTITTLAASDSAPPLISGVSVSKVNGSSGLVTWYTNEPGTSQVQYGPTTAYGFTTTLDNTLTTAHAQVFSGLSAATTYHFRVLSRDKAGNLAVSKDFTLSTLVAANTPPTALVHVATGVYPQLADDTAGKRVSSMRMRGQVVVRVIRRTMMALA